MSRWVQWGAPILVLGAILIATLSWDADKRVQVVAPLLVWFAMFSLQTLLVWRPNVIVEDMSEEADYAVDRELNVFVNATILNKSSTSSAHIRDVDLVIGMNPSADIIVPVNSGVPNIIGFRLEPNGMFPGRNLWFQVVPPYQIDDSMLSGKVAMLRLRVVNQRDKRYQIRMKSK